MRSRHIDSLKTEVTPKAFETMSGDEFAQEEIDLLNTFYSKQGLNDELFRHFGLDTLRKAWITDSDDATEKESNERLAELYKRNKLLYAEYKKSIEILIMLDKIAYDFLAEVLGKENLKLPIDIADVAKRVGITITVQEELTDMHLTEHDVEPNSKLMLRGGLIKETDRYNKVLGVIGLNDNLSDAAWRYEVAYQLSHLLLRSFNIGMCALYPPEIGLSASTYNGQIMGTSTFMHRMLAEALLCPYELCSRLINKFLYDTKCSKAHRYIDMIAYLCDSVNAPEYICISILDKFLKCRALLYEKADESKKNRILFG